MLENMLNFKKTKLQISDKCGSRVLNTFRKIFLPLDTSQKFLLRPCIAAQALLAVPGASHPALLFGACGLLQLSCAVMSFIGSAGSVEVHICVLHVETTKVGG